MIYTFTAGGNGLLSAVADGAQPNIPGASGMTALTTDSSRQISLRHQQYSPPAWASPAA